LVIDIFDLVLYGADTVLNLRFVAVSGKDIEKLFERVHPHLATLGLQGVVRLVFVILLLASAFNNHLHAVLKCILAFRLRQHGSLMCKILVLLFEAFSIGGQICNPLVDLLLPLVFVFLERVKVGICVFKLILTESPDTCNRFSSMKLRAYSTQTFDVLTHVNCESRHNSWYVVPLVFAVAELFIIETVFNILLFDSFE
jgi:hypothetical protein